MKKSGGGGRNWGNDAAADVDSAAATADSAETEGTGWGAGASNGTAGGEVCCVFSFVGPCAPHSIVIFAAGGCGVLEWTCTGLHSWMATTKSRSGEWGLKT